MNTPEEDDILAGELALGVLGGDDAIAARARASSDPAFARTVAAWERRFAALADELTPVDPPKALKAKIEAAIARPAQVGSVSQPTPARPGWREPVRVWQLAAAGFGALALTELALLVMWATPDRDAPVIAEAPRPSPPLVAALVPADAASPVIASLDLPAGTLSVDPSGIEADGRAVQLWLLPPDGGAPVSLGLLVPNTDNRITIQIAGFEGDALPSLAISLEPEGGSPTGAPTGPVVASGPVTRL